MFSVPPLAVQILAAFKNLTRDLENRAQIVPDLGDHFFARTPRTVFIGVLKVI